jgi:hypothetical protein
LLHRKHLRLIHHDRSARRVLIAIPAYNEEANITKTVERVRQALPDCDLIGINDGTVAS